jgi:hypothetical protein
MSGFARALVGAYLGAVLTLLAHPASRPLMTQAFRSPIHETSVRVLGESEATGRLAPPETLVDASVWMHAGAMRLRSPEPLVPRELQSLLRVAEAAARQEGDNAYWRQMAAVFQIGLGDRNGAAENWIKASHAARWNDYQSVRLLQERDRIAKAFGAAQAWQLALAYHARGDEAALAIDAAARKLLDGAGFDRVDELALRAATARNGDLLRNGARSVRIGVIGAGIVEAASHPSRLRDSSQNKRLVLARLQLINALQGEGFEDDAARTDLIYRANDGWIALTGDPADSRRATELAGWSVLAAVAPGSFLLIGAFGLLLYFCGRMLRSQKPAITAPAVLGAGSLLGLIVYALTMLPLAGLAVGLCFGFVGFTPRNERSHSGEDLGPFFSFTVGLLALTLVAVLFALSASTSVAARSVLPQIGWPIEFVHTSTLYVVLGLIVLGLIFLVAPLWAFAHRIRTQSVLSLGLRKMGTMLAALCVTGAVISGPVAVHLDRKVGDTLQKLVENEPVYYLLQ